MMGSVSLNGVTMTALTLLFTICVLARLDYAVAKVLPTGLGENATICGSAEFQCRDSKCIPSELLCDGRTDCKDNSDEVQSECSKPDVLCPDYAFRCAYGACVHRDAACNGVKDCFDNSDEELPRCSGVASSNKSDSGVCSATQYRCDNGLCIDEIAICDGQADCRDNSDETFRVCGSFSCPQVAFRCTYGACIDADKRCDSKHDCADGSDEDPASCGVHRTIRAIEPMTTERNITTHTTTQITCPPLVTPSLIIDSCLFSNNSANCGVPVSPGTSARLWCANGYKKDKSDIEQNENILCKEDGHWDPKPIHCIPVCGTTGSSDPAVINGAVANLTQFPWHATLYRQKKKNGAKVFICGATIIQPNLLITAAHCVYDDFQQIVQPATTFHVAAGNLFQGFDSFLHDERVVQKRQVKNIYIYRNYLGLFGNYASDIAVLELIEPFTLSTLLLPICMDFSGFDDSGVLEPGAVGKFAGFGRSSSSILQTVEVPFVPYGECRSNQSEHSKALITEDKFCGRYSNGAGACVTASGEGLVFKTGDLWYLRGIVSVGLGTGTDTGRNICDDLSYILFTRISKYLTWINNVTLHVQSPSIL